MNTTLSKTIGGGIRSAKEFNKEHSMTLSHETVIQNFPAATGLAIGARIVATGVPSSDSKSGVCAVSIKRMTEGFYKVVRLN